MLHANIVPYREQDHDALVEIWRRAVIHTHTFLTTEDIQFYDEIVRSGALREVEIWVERYKEIPIGFIGLNGTKIEMLFVAPDFHGKGVGTRLFHHVKQLKGEKLQVDVNEQNEGAYLFYKKLGFVQVRRSELDPSGRAHPLLHLEL
ncbi:GNAT family N-acetyltransferase [Paenibacillus tarimensis]|uniref:GNAT family N-acetyltransferase n=1 Tax=Paenibacillus tarimensis TaxID=416012 RepID=UPI001F3FF0B0|nr:GNAT family N-acetyltransferase [Paenibacillus tarimensis]MCF2942784.1 GNAT family N-acetyltransferase [Paenibacillus tarimensis]